MRKISSHDSTFINQLSRRISFAKQVILLQESTIIYDELSGQIFIVDSDGPIHCELRMAKHVVSTR
jgi:hypothetical protein